MQQGNDPLYGSVSVQGAAVMSPSLHLSPDGQHLSSLRRLFSSSEELVNRYPSVFSCKKSPLVPSPTKHRSSMPVSLTPSSLSFQEEVEDDAANIEHRLYLARLRLQYQEMLDRYELCLSHLDDAAGEAEALRLENAKLRNANAELARRLTLVSTYGKRGSGGGRMRDATAGYLSTLLNELHRLGLSSDSSRAESIPTSPPAFHLGSRFSKKAPVPDHRSTLPKSISIRSSGYTKLSTTDRNGRTRVSSPVIVGSQKVYEPVEEGDEDGGARLGKVKDAGTLDLEVYAQGMFKTELCNKWQETGACPYGENCQFAHGVGELRPVIRHPRYKTEICRMILAGGTCPYGHRCHFRHALTPQDYPLLRPTV